MKKIGLCAPYQFDFAESSGSVFPDGMELFEYMRSQFLPAIRQRAGLRDRLFVVLCQEQQKEPTWIHLPDRLTFNRKI